jgi:predicted SAM-dependent methyltransferase
MSHSLEHFNPGSIPQVVEGVSVMLRAGGCFFCEVPNANLTKYPNAGERVVPHLSFFSEESLQRVVTSKGLMTRFLSTCGDNQIGKNQEVQLAWLEKSGAFVYVPDPETGVLRNQKYHEYLREKTRRQQLRRMVLNLLMRIHGRRLLFKAIDLLRRWRQQPHNEVLSSSMFCYGKDREFIRLLAQK